jgi:hypothetical protein
MGEGNENLIYPSLWDFKSSLTCRNILRHGTFPLYFPSERKVCCGFLSPLKSIGLAEIEPATFGSSSKHTNHYKNRGDRMFSYTMPEVRAQQEVPIFCLPSHITHFLQPLDRPFFKLVALTFYRMKTGKSYDMFGRLSFKTCVRSETYQYRDSDL